MVNMTNDIDLPLSEIISKKKITLKRQRPAFAGTTGGGIQKAKQVVAAKSATQQMAIKKVGDARNKIVQLKRNQFKDAREQLAQFAKGGDVRDKLNKIRKVGLTSGPAAATAAAVKKPVDMRQKLNLKRSNTVIKKLPTTGKLQQQGKANTMRVLNTGLQTRKKNTTIIRTVSGMKTAQSAQAIQKRQRVTAPASNVSRTISTQSAGPIRRTAVNAQNRAGRGPYTTTVSQRQNVTTQQQRGQPRTIFRQANNAVRQQPRQQARPNVVRQTQVRRTLPPNTVYITEEPQPVYRRIPVGRSPASSRARLEPLRQPRAQYVVEEDAYLPARPQTVVYRTQPAPRQVVYADEVGPYEEDYQGGDVYYQDQTDSASYYEPEYSEVYVPPPARSQQQYGPAPPPLMRTPVGPPQRSSYSSYSSGPSNRASQYVSRPQPARRSAPAVRQFTRPAQQAAPAPPKVLGHKVTVGNLRAATREDIEELFGNIGPVVQCTMLRRDTASVVFSTLEDAKKSVEVYHNRKLDNHPMQVKVVGTITEGGSTPRGGNRVRTMY